jgi:type II secretory pathway pseudopilin PulG
MMVAIKKYNSGFSYVESIIAIILTLAIATAALSGISEGISWYQKLIIKEKALNKLMDYTNEYRAMIAYGEKPLQGKQPPGGHDVTIYDPSEEYTELSSYAEPYGIVKGKLWHKIEDMSHLTAGDQSGYFNIKTWITWNDGQYFGYGDEKKHIAFEVDQLVLIK